MPALRMLAIKSLSHPPRARPFPPNLPTLQSEAIAEIVSESLSDCHSSTATVSCDPGSSSPSTTASRYRSGMPAPIADCSESGSYNRTGSLSLTDSPHNSAVPSRRPVSGTRALPDSLHLRTHVPVAQDGPLEADPPVTAAATTVGYNRP